MNKHTIFLIIFCISLPLFLIIFSYKATLFFSDLTDAQQNVIGFLNNKEVLQGNYTANEISHLEDVKEVMKLTDYAFYVLLLIVTLTLTYYKKNKEQLKKLLKCGGIATIVILLFLILITFFSFNFSFTIFHKIFFPQGNWIFPNDFLLIQTFPLEFFMRTAVKIFVVAFGFGIVMLMFGTGSKRKKKHNGNN